MATAIDNLSTYLLAYRCKHNLSQGEIARLIGSTRQQVWRWENNISKPHNKYEIKLRRLLSISTCPFCGA